MSFLKHMYSKQNEKPNYSTGSLGPHRCCPLRTKLRISTVVKSRHDQVIPCPKCLSLRNDLDCVGWGVKLYSNSNSNPKCPFPCGSGSSPSTWVDFLVPVSSHHKRHLDRFIRFHGAHAVDQQTRPRYVCVTVGRILCYALRCDAIL